MERPVSPEEVAQPSGSQAVRSSNERRPVSIEEVAQPSDSQAERSSEERRLDSSEKVAQPSDNQVERSSSGSRQYQESDLILQASSKCFMNNILAHTSTEPEVAEMTGSIAVVTQPSVRKGHRKPDEQSGSQDERSSDERRPDSIEKVAQP